MDRGRGIKTAAAVVATFVVLFAFWLSLGGFREGGEEPFPARTAGQTMLPSSSADSEPDVPTEASASTASSSQSGGTDPVSGLAWVVVSDLPPEVAETLDAIDAGPPYPYDRDGVTFENREGLLPDEEYGYYQEFTVTTPGSDDRGARRVIWGLGDEFYYTDDHYDSFVRIDR